jgi:NADPH:quinone reductase-like Zn-dependent oxidoreductase
MSSSWVPGLDVSGQITEIGIDVKGWKIGEKVLCHGNMLRPHGGFAEYTIQEADTLVPHPKLSPEVAAATPCAGWTAWRALVNKLRVNEHDSILITGGSGGVGSFAIQIARYFGLKTIITTCSARNHEYVKELGVTHAIDYRNEDVVSRVLEITNQQGVEIGLDTVGAENDVITANSLAYEGQMAEIAGVVRPSRYKDVYSKGLSFHQFSLGSGHRYGPAAKAILTTAGREFSSLVELGHVETVALKSITMDEVGQALIEILEQRTVGKIVMKV